MSAIVLEAPKFAVLKAPGINRDEATKAALEAAGGRADILPVNALISGETNLADYQGLIISGGFSYGDDIASGVVLATQLRTQYGDEILEHALQRKRPVVGICNGFQVLTQMGLLPFGEIVSRDRLHATLTNNDSGRFRSSWIDVKPQESKSLFVAEDVVMTFPVAHGEGRFVASEDTLNRIEENGQVVWRYVDERGNQTQEYPLNPNGSLRAIAGITDPSGVIFGAMPHPEDFVRKEHYPNWRRTNSSREPDGLKFFRSVVLYARGI